MDPMFPELPENLSELSDEDLEALLQRHETACELIDAEDPEFTKGLSADELIAELGRGVEQIETIVAEQKRRVEEQEAYLASKAELAERRKAALGAEEAAEEEATEEETEGEVETLAAEAESETEAEAEEDDGEGDGDGDGAVVEEIVEEPRLELAVASKPALRRPVPAPTPEREAKGVPTAPLIAAAGLAGVRGGQVLDRLTLADSMKKLAQSLGPPSKSASGIEQRFALAQANFPYPPERRLVPGDPDANARKIQAIVPPGIPGVVGNPQVMVASGGLCAPLEPIYTMPNFTSQVRPVRDALPSFQAERGGVNVPTATYIGDITTAISIITEAEDALGGTYATKSCQDLTCPEFVETAVTVLAHCREYGNLNARAWPEKIAHENDLTMAAHARASDGYLLDQIRALSIKLTVAQVINAYADMARALMQARAAIINVLRMDDEATFRVLAPSWLRDLLAADVASTQFDRFQAQAAMAAHLSSLGFAISWYKDAVTLGTSQMFAAAADGVLAAFPSTVQIAVFPEGEFLHIDAGTLDLGIVRDSTLNSTNDFQVFGETFENVVRLGPAQGAYWLSIGVCPTGEFPDLATAYTC